MSELWIKKSPTDVHRLIDNKLPEGSKCTGVAMTSLDEGAVEEYVATINGEEVIVQAPAEESASDVADALVAQAPAPLPPPEPSSEPAQLEGEDQPTETQVAAEEEYVYDDSEDDEPEEYEADEDVDAPPKPKTKSKKKSKKK